MAPQQPTHFPPFRGKARGKPRGRSLAPDALDALRQLLGDEREQPQRRQRDLLIEHLSKRHEKRVHWQKRYEDPAFQKVAKDCRPMTLPIFRELNGDVSLGESLNGSISQVHDFRARYELILKKRS